MQLEIKNINKSYSGVHILHDISFTVESGKAMGFLGRNGAGKTTTIRALMDVFRPDSGGFYLDGKPLSRDQVRIGYMPEERGMYQEVPLVDQLVYFGELKGMSKKDAQASAMNWIDRMELTSYAKKNLKTLSKGNQQKIQIIQAVIDDPEILILDEPFSGLDPVNAQFLKHIIQEFIDKNRLVIFSSHQMSTVEEFCDDITLIRKGRIILSDNLTETKRRLGENRLQLETSVSHAELQTTLAPLGVSVEQDPTEPTMLLTLPSTVDANQVLHALVSADIPVQKFQYYEPSLEKIFIDLDREMDAKEKGISHASNEEGGEGK